MIEMVKRTKILTCKCSTSKCIFEIGTIELSKNPDLLLFHFCPVSGAKIPIKALNRNYVDTDTF